MKLTGLVSMGVFAMSLAVGCKKDPPPAPAPAPVPEPAAVCAAMQKLDPTSPDSASCVVIAPWLKAKNADMYKCMATCVVGAKTKADYDKCDTTCAPSLTKFAPADMTTFGSITTPLPNTVCAQVAKNDPTNPENATCAAVATMLQAKYPAAFACLGSCELLATSKAESDKCTETCKSEMAKIKPEDIAAMAALQNPVVDAGAPAAADAAAATGDAAPAAASDDDGGAPEAAGDAGEDPDGGEGGAAEEEDDNK